MKFSTAALVALTITGTINPSRAGPAECTGGSKYIEQMVNGQPYDFCFFGKGLTFDTAKQSCASIKGMRLVEPRTVDDREAVSKACQAAVGRDGYDCTWLSIVCSTKDAACATGFADWYYPDGTSLATIPKAANGMEIVGGSIGGGQVGEYCAHFWGNKTPQQWAPHRCETTYYGGLCEPIPGQGGSAHGDPHFVQWSGEKYDFHGGCDLVFLQNPNFANGLGMNIHIRTKIKTWWSYIEAATLEIGGQTLEIQGGKNGAHFWINHASKMELQTQDASLGDYPVHFKRMSDHQTRTRIDLGDADAISIETFKDFVRVNVNNKSNKSFHGSSGLMGSYPSGKKVGRDGTTVFDDNNAFGQEWMVLSSEPNLFHSATEVKGEKCSMPDKTASAQKRRLGENSITEEEAAAACARVNERDIETCIFDVMATQDKDLAGSY